MTGKRRRIVAKGQTYLVVGEGTRERELNNGAIVQVEDGQSQWEVATLPAERSEVVTSTSPHVSVFLENVFASMERQQRRHIVHPAPKPTSKAKRSQQSPAGLVPCPLCNGEGWFGCAICDGEGMVPAHVFDD